MKRATLLVPILDIPAGTYYDVEDQVTYLNLGLKDHDDKRAKMDAVTLDLTDSNKVKIEQL